MQWHTGMVALSQKDVVLYRATSPMTMSSQTLPRSHGAGSLAPRGVLAEGSSPATRLRIALVESLLVGAHMFNQSRKEVALVRILDNPIHRNSAHCRGKGISNTWSVEAQGLSS